MHHGSADTGLVMTSEADELHRGLHPEALAVLIDLLLDAIGEDAGWVPATSARLIADHLHISPEAAARGLRKLRRAELVHLVRRRPTASDRFGLDVYVPSLPDGILLVGVGWSPATAGHAPWPSVLEDAGAAASQAPIAGPAGR